MFTRHMGLGVVSLVALSGCALVQARMTLGGGDQFVVSTENNRIVVTDADTGRVLFDQRSERLYDGRNHPELVVPAVEVVPQDAGFDLVYTYTNDTAYNRPLADMRVGVINMPDSLVMQDGNMRGGDDVPFSHDERPTIAYTYPSNIYAPVYTFHDNRYAVGVSVQYPLMEYQHDMQFRLESGRTDGPADQYRGWRFDLRMSALDGDTQGKKGWVSYSASLAPHETKVYTVSVRFTSHPEEWVRTLTPYRDYFRDLYGGVQYTRRDGAVMGYSTGTDDKLSRDNPYGFREEKLRPDLHGYGPMVDSIMESTGWPEVLLYKASGQYLMHRGWNYPFLTFSPLDRDENFRSAFDPQIGLASIPNRGRDLALWWGRALQVAKQWDPIDCEPLDINNPDHLDRARAELDAAARLGATTIGLDCFSHNTVPVWDSYRWLREMKQEYPQFHFIVEPMACDALHTLAATWIRGWDENAKHLNVPDDVYRIQGPHILADFLLPGNERTLAMRYQALLDNFGIPETQDRIDADVARFAAWGYRPVIFSSLNLTTDVRAAETYLTDIPQDLQIPRDQWHVVRDPFHGNGDLSDGRDSRFGSSGGAGDAGHARVTRTRVGGGGPSASINGGGGNGGKNTPEGGSGDGGDKGRAANLKKLISSGAKVHISRPSFTPEQIRKAREAIKSKVKQDD